MVSCGASTYLGVPHPRGSAGVLFRGAQDLNLVRFAFKANALPMS